MGILPTRPTRSLYYQAEYLPQQLENLISTGYQVDTPLKQPYHQPYSTNHTYYKHWNSKPSRDANNSFMAAYQILGTPNYR